MSYDTRYKLTILEGDPYSLTDLLEECSWASACLRNNGQPKESLSWYEHEDHLCEFSEKHPDTLFLLEGEGEDHADQWRKYFKNGKMQECRALITYPEYDPKLLK